MELIEENPEKCLDVDITGNNKCRNTKGSTKASQVHKKEHKSNAGLGREQKQEADRLR